MREVAEIFDEKPQTFSFEFSPPETDQGRANPFKAAGALAPMADYFSVTHGAKPPRKLLTDPGDEGKLTFDAPARFWAYTIWEIPANRLTTP